MIRTREDRMKILYTQLEAAEMRLEVLHEIYSGNKDMRVMRKIQDAQRDMKRIGDAINAAEKRGAGLS